ncbi:MAG TPA: hypothetical protein VIJ79_17310, partial [Acidobacteriaceae bacterium]
TGIRGPDMLTGMTERDWSIVLEVFDAAQSSRGEPGHDDRKFLEALHYGSRTSRAGRRVARAIAVPLMGCMADEISAACPIATTVSSNTAGIVPSRRLVIKCTKCFPGAGPLRRMSDVGAIEQNRDRLLPKRFLPFTG